MENEDKRKLSLETKYELRKQVVRLKQSGRQTSEIVEITGLQRLCQPHLEIISSWRARGDKDTTPREAGRRKASFDLRAGKSIAAADVG